MSGLKIEKSLRVEAVVYHHALDGSAKVVGGCRVECGYDGKFSVLSPGGDALHGADPEDVASCLAACVMGQKLIRDAISNDRNGAKS